MNLYTPNGWRFTGRGISSPTLVWCALAAFASMQSASVAHEGHAPLPTKGAQVDVATGQVTLSADARTSLGVETGDVRLQTMEQTVLAYARVSLDWQQHQFVTTPIAGRIARLHAKPGESVRQGQALAEIESTELTDLQVQLLDAENSASLSRQTLARVESLAKDQVVAGRDLAEALAAHRENEVAIEIAKSRLKRLRLSDEAIDELVRRKKPIRSLPILSPLTGVAIHTDLALGKVVEPIEHLFEVINLDSVTVRVDVLERDLGRVEPGQAVRLEVTSFPGVRFEGVISSKEAYIDAETHLGRAWVSMTNAAEAERRLIPGMYGEAQIVVSPVEKKLTVPKEALLTNGTEWFVLVEEAATARGSEYRKRNVAVGLIDGRSAEITAGDVFPGDRVVTTGGHQMSNFFIQGVLRLSLEARQNLGVSVEAARPQHVAEVIEVDGAIDLPPEQRAVASSQLPGTIERILVERGQSVRAGDIIAEISSLELLEIQYKLLQADVQLGLIDRTLGRLQQVGRDQLLAKKRLQELESNREAMLYRRDSAKQRLGTLGLTAERIDELLTDKQVIQFLPVRAPIDGALVGFDKSLGQVIQADQPLFEIHDLSRIVVRAHLGERQIAKVPVGTSARVRVVAEPAFVGEGEVVRGGSIFGEENRTASAWIELDEAPANKLYHEMLARVTFIAKSEESVLAVPRAALINEGIRRFVFVEDATGLLERRAVKTGRVDDQLVEITAGLKAGELVAVDGAAGLQTAYASLR